MKPDQIKVDILDCSRCGGSHRNLVAKKLLRASRYRLASREYRDIDTFSYHSVCPNTLEPILVGLIGDQK